MKGEGPIGAQEPLVGPSQRVAKRVLLPMIRLMLLVSFALALVSLLMPEELVFKGLPFVLDSLLMLWLQIRFVRIWGEHSWRTRLMVVGICVVIVFGAAGVYALMCGLGSSAFPAAAHSRCSRRYQGAIMISHFGLPLSAVLYLLVHLLPEGREGRKRDDSSR